MICVYPFNYTEKKIGIISNCIVVPKLVLMSVIDLLMYISSQL